MAFCEVATGKIHYETHGKGDALLLLRGLGRSSRYWLGYEKLLAKHFRVIMIDPRGLGQSTATMSWNDSIETLAQDCLLVLDRLRIKRTHIFGLSLGGMVAMAIAKAAPERVRTLVVANSSSADGFGMRLQALAVLQLARSLFRGSFHQTLLARLVPPEINRSRGPELLADWQKLLDVEGFPILTIAKQLAASGRFLLGSLPAKGWPPTLVLVGTGDRFVPPTCSRRLKKLLPGSTLREVKGAGHEIHIGHEKQISDILRKFAGRDAS